jgi:hypothetical protein
MKKLFKYTLPVVALCALAACSDDTTAGGNNTLEPIAPNAGKEAIAFAPEGSGVTRAEGDPVGFDENTKVVMRIKAQNGTSTDRTDYRYTQAVLKAGAKNSTCCTAWGMSYEHNHLSYIDGNTRYWDDAFGRESKLAIYAVAVPNQANPTHLGHTILDQASTDITAINSTTNPNWYTVNEGKEENTKIEWTVSKKQDGSTMLQEDLAYSNNIRYYDTNPIDDKEKGRYHQTYNEANPEDWTKSMQWGRLEWQAKESGSTVGKFDQGHLLFKHALTYLEINLTEGAGFDHTANTDFIWTNEIPSTGQHIRLIGFPITGNLDLSKGINTTGMWTPTTPTAGTDDITQLKSTYTRENVTKFKLECYVIPGTTLDGNNNNLLEFEIDNAKYYVTGEQIATAIQGHTSYASTSNVDKSTMAGKHYVINLTVGKTKITNITAAILPWEDVNTTEIPADNAVCTFSFEDERGTDVMEDKFNLYRAQMTSDNNAEVEETDAYITNETAANYNWVTGYATDGKADKEYVSGTPSGHWKTKWYWPNNKIFYHFRAAGLNKSSDLAITTDAISGDYFTIQHGPLTGGSYEDWIWGAPFTKKDNSYKIIYTSEKGFDNNQDGTTTKQISPAIAATHDVINMLLFHMTSQITVNLTTTSGDDKVVLQNGSTKTQVKIVRFLPTGKVRMGTGKVEADGTRDTGTGVTMTDASTSHTDATTGVAEKLVNYTYGKVPQSLTGWGDAIGLEITTPDGNTYYVRDLSTITAKVSNTDPYSLKETNLKNPYTLASGSTDDYVINEWFPHYKYVYNITLKKKGILDITAAILPWEVVEGNNIDIDLEN